MTTATEKGASLEVQEAFNRLQDRFRKYGSLDIDITDAELRSKTGRLLQDEIYQGAVFLVQALAGAEAAATQQQPRLRRCGLRRRSEISGSPGSSPMN